MPMRGLECAPKTSSEVSQSEALTGLLLLEESEAEWANRPGSWPGGKWVGRSDPPWRPPIARFLSGTREGVEDVAQGDAQAGEEGRLEHADDRKH